MSAEQDAAEAAWLSPEPEHCPEWLISHDDFVKLFLAGVAWRDANPSAEVQALKAEIVRLRSQVGDSDACCTNVIEKSAYDELLAKKECLERALAFAKMFIKNEENYGQVTGQIEEIEVIE